MLFAAIEAADHGGRQTVVEAVSDLSQEAMIIIEESKKDDSEDKDGDGKSDVGQLSNKEYMARKTKVRLCTFLPFQMIISNDNAVCSLSFEK